MIHWKRWNQEDYSAPATDHFYCDNCHADITRRVKRAFRARKLWSPVRYFIPGLPADDYQLTGDQWCFDIPFTNKHIAITLFKRHRWGS